MTLFCCKFPNITSIIFGSQHNIFLKMTLKYEADRIYRLLRELAALSIISIERGPDFFNPSVISAWFGNTSNNEAISHEDAELQILVDRLAAGDKEVLINLDIPSSLMSQI